MALAAVGMYGGRPLGSSVHPDMRAVFESHRAGIYTHVFASVVALAIGPWQFVASWRARRPRLHRALGRAYLLAVATGGASALYMSRFAFGGAVSTSGFALLAVVWLYTGFRAYRSARRREFAQHRRWMVRNFGLTFAAVTLRIYLVIGFALEWRFEVFYPWLAWVGWVPNLFVAECLLRRDSAGPTSAGPPVARTAGA